MERKAWFCPSCQKHHGPHVDTCPGVSGAQPAPAPGNPVVIPQPMPYRREPQPWETPWMPYWPQVTCGIYQPRFDPDKIVVVN